MDCDQTQPCSSKSESSTNCDVCTMPIECVKLKYKCSTCELKSDSSEGVSSFLCEMCITSHTRRKHEVLDYKQMKVVVCEQHFVCCNSFCKDCDRLICSMCLPQHAIEKHTVMLLEQRANEIKRDIHDAISKVDKEYKTTVKNSDDARLVWEQMTKLRSDLSGEHAIKEQVLQVCRETLDELDLEINKASESAMTAETKASEVFKNVEGIRDSMESKQSIMRDLLSLSDGCLVKQFTKGCLDVEKHHELCLLPGFSDDASSMFTTPKQNLKKLIRVALNHFITEVFGTIESFHSEVPDSCSLFASYRNQKISLAASDSHLCIAHYMDGDSGIEFELSDKQGRNTSKWVPKVDKQWFRVFSCFGGIVFQIDQKGFRALKTVIAFVGVTDRWEINVQNLLGFFYHKGKFQHHCYTLAASNDWIWKFSDCAYGECHLRKPSNFFVYSTTLNLLSWAWSSGSSTFCIYLKGKKFEGGDLQLGNFDASKIQILTNIRVTFESLHDKIVVIAYSIMENECEFVYQAYNTEARYKQVGQTHFKSVAIKGVDSIQFFNSDCYFATKEGLILRLGSFFSEL